jgi:predicted RND superfamily exporter protein
MQEVLDKTLAMPQFAGLEAGMTGGNLIQDFESDKGLTSGFLFTGILTLAVIILIFALSFKRPLLPLATALPLVLGVALAAAVASIAFGGLNIFSMCFAVLLLGMGIDYAIHILSRYGEQRMSGDGLEEALTHTIEKTGMSMLIGTATTALTFLSFLFAKMNAFEQMGIISALGIFLAMGSQILVTPALIAWADLKKSKNEKKYAGAAAFRFMEPVGKLCARHGIALAIITVGVMAALFPNVRNVSVNGDVSSLYPDSLPSLKWLEMVKEEFEYNPDEISLMANDIDQLYIMTSELNALESIGTVDSIAQYLPEDKALREATLAYLPDAVKDKYIGKTGKFLIKVTANGDIWDSDRIAKVREDLSSITPYLGGMPVLMDEVVGIVIDDAILCSGLAALAILIILLVMFRSLKLAFLAFLPIAATVYFLFGLLPVFGGELTLTSVIAIPLVIGIGVSGAVHITNRVKATNDIPSTLVFTGKAVILSAVTTLIGFGSLMFSGHPALADLGLVVTGGLSISLLLNLILLPAILGIGMSKPKR